MKTLKISILILLVTYANLYGQSNLTKYQKKVLPGISLPDTKENLTPDDYVTIKFYADNDAEPLLNLEKKEKRNLFNLTEKGQEAFIEAIDAKTPNDVKAFIDALSKNLTEPPKPKQPYRNVNRRIFVKKIEIDIEDMTNKTDKIKGGRIDELLIRVKLPDNDKIKFISLKNIVTKYEVVDFGKIGLTRNQSFSINAGVNFAGTGSTASSRNTTTEGQYFVNNDMINQTDVAGNSSATETSNTSNLGIAYALGRTLSEEVNVKKRRIAMKGNVGPKEIVIYQEGAPELNLNDKITIELIFEGTGNNLYSDFCLDLDSLYKDGNPITDPQKHKIDPYFITFSKLPQNIDVTVECDYVYREILNNKGRNSPGEWDDKIRYVKLKNPISITETLLKKDEIQLEKWDIKSNDDFLYIDYYGEKTKLNFNSISSAESFFFWLKRTKSLSFKGLKLMLGNNDLKKSDINNLKTHYYKN